MAIVYFDKDTKDLLLTKDNEYHFVDKDNEWEFNTIGEFVLRLRPLKKYPITEDGHLAHEYTGSKNKQAVWLADHFGLTKRLKYISPKGEVEVQWQQLMGTTLPIGFTKGAIEQHTDFDKVKYLTLHFQEGQNSFPMLANRIVEVIQNNKGTVIVLERAL